MVVHFTLYSTHFNFKLTELSYPNVQYCYKETPPIKSRDGMFFFIYCSSFYKQMSIYFE